MILCCQWRGLCSSVRPEQLMGVYRIPAFEGAEGLLQEISLARGKLLPGGVPNIEAAARIVLQVSAAQPYKHPFLV